MGTLGNAAVATGAIGSNGYRVVPYLTTSTSSLAKSLLDIVAKSSVD
jgi:hypothetical protein